MQRIAVFASGTGTNFQALLDAQANGLFDHKGQNGQENYQEKGPTATIQTPGRLGEIVLLVTDKPNCGAVSRATQANVPVATFIPKQFATKSDYEQEVLRVLDEYEIDWIVLAGYMRLIGPDLLHVYSNRIINLHPSLLPAFQGKDAIGQAYAYGVKYTGVTIHFVDEGMDTGPIIMQQPVEIEATDSIESLTGKIQAVEHTLLPAAVAHLLSYPFEIDGRTVRFREER
jgi:phosphoribosylglycinamide formyltransferase-1